LPHRPRFAPELRKNKVQNKIFSVIPQLRYPKYRTFGPKE
jgi:hypothetical protein